MSDKDQLEKLFQELNSLLVRPSFADFLTGPNTREIVRFLLLLFAGLLDKKVFDLNDLEELIKYMKEPLDKGGKV